MDTTRRGWLGWGLALSLVAGALAVSLPGCGEANGPKPWQPFKGEYPIKAVCTTGMVADLVKKVGGDKVAVTQIMGEDVDPHLYKASPEDVRTLHNADVIFYSGLHLEGKMTSVFEELGRERSVLAVAEQIDPKRLIKDGEEVDPHVWFDVSLWNEARGHVVEALKKLDPPNADYYEDNGREYRKALDGLHARVRKDLATIQPRSRRVLVTAHDAFSYFGRAYDIDVKGIQGISTTAEASVKDINDLVDFIAANKVKAVFVETSVNQRNMKSLVEGCKARGHDVVIGGQLFSDAMGKEGTTQGTYVGMVEHNVKTIVNALR
jgi:manganese/zinc/iron transport system substrate-binding protein